MTRLPFVDVLTATSRIFVRIVKIYNIYMLLISNIFVVRKNTVDLSNGNAIFLNTLNIQ